MTARITNLLPFRAAYSTTYSPFQSCLPSLSGARHDFFDCATYLPTFSDTIDANGDYWLVGLSYGHYDLQLDLSGFASTAIENIELLVGQNASIPLSMKLATVNETIVVSDAALVDDPFLAELESDARYRDLMARLRLPIRR